VVKQLTAAAHVRLLGGESFGVNALGCAERADLDSMVALGSAS
jgi:hypothetical protein